MSIPVFYTSKMLADSECVSPSAMKPEKVVESWKKFDVNIIEPEPASLEEIAMAHDRKFVEGILSCKIANGFGNKSEQVAKALPYTSGSMLSAARHVLKSKTKVAAAPCSGFHHAGYRSAEGFCTFNGLMITALAIKNEGLAEKIGILDLDMHYGNGTDNIIKKLEIDWIYHFTGGRNYIEPSQAEEFFDTRLPKVLTELAKCDIVLYQAGADPHIDDPFGGWLTTEQLRKRDEIVFTALREHVPVVWNLAGGYQVEKDGSIPKVLEIHDNTMKECSKIYLI